MAINITTTNLEEIKAIAIEYLDKAENEKNLEARKALENDLEEVINYYTATSKAACFEAAKNSGNAMHYAVKEFFFPAIKIKEDKVKDTDVVVRRIEDTQKPIDLGELHKKLGGIGADKNWLYAAEKLNFYLTKRAADRLGVKIKTDAFVMNEISKKVDLGKNPVSNTALLKTLNTVISAMLGTEYKALSHDVNYLVDVYVNDNKKSKTGVTAANHKTLRNYLKKVCYRILTNGKGYDVQQKEIKE